MAKKTKRSPKARKPKGPQDLGLRTGEEIKFVGKLPDRGTVIAILGDGGFRVTLDVGEGAEQVRAMKQMWDLIQTAFEVHLEPPIGRTVSFMATFPTRGGAMSRHGDGGARLTLDVAQEEAAPMALCMGLIQKELHVRIGPRLGALPSKDGEGSVTPAKEVKLLPHAVE
jgi:hypothetical protein